MTSNNLTKASFSLNGNFDVQAAAPFDARTLVTNVSDLYNIENFKSRDNVVYLFNGLLVAIITTKELYILQNYTPGVTTTLTESNWKKVGDISHLIGESEWKPWGGRGLLGITDWCRIYYNEKPLWICVPYDYETHITTPLSDITNIEVEEDGEVSREKLEALIDDGVLVLAYNGYYSPLGYIKNTMKYYLAEIGDHYFFGAGEIENDHSNLYIDTESVEDEDIIGGLYSAYLFRENPNGIWSNGDKHYDISPYMVGKHNGKYFFTKSILGETYDGEYTEHFSIDEIKNIRIDEYEYKTPSGDTFVTLDGCKVTKSPFIEKPTFNKTVKQINEDIQGLLPLIYAGL